MGGFHSSRGERASRAVFALGIAAFAIAVVVGSWSAWHSELFLPSGSAGYHHSVRALHRSGNVDAAIAELHADQRINVQDLRSSLLLAKLLDAAGRPGEIEALQFAADHSLDPTVHLKLAAALATAGRADDAEAAVDRALLLGPDRPYVRAASGQVLETAGRSERARREYRSALELDPANREAQQGLMRLQPSGARS